MTTVYVAAALVVFILGMSDPVLFIYAGVGLLIGYATAASWMWGVWHDRAVAAESDAIFAKDEVAHLKRLYGDATGLAPHRSLASEAIARFSQQIDDALGVRRPDLSIVPTQRDGHEPWPPVARAVEAETTPVFDDLCFDRWELWGEEADRDA